MPGAADGSIIIDTEIDSKGFERDSSKLQTAVTSFGRQVDRLGPTLRKAMSGSASAMTSFTERADKAEATVAELEQQLERLGEKRVQTQAYTDLVKEADKAKAKLDAAHADMDDRMAKLGEERVPTQAYADLQKETEAAGRELERLLNRQEKMNELGVSKNSQGYKTLIYDLEQASTRYDQLVAASQRMEASGTAYTVPAEYQKMSAALDTLEAAYARLAASKREMEASGEAYTLGSETAQYQELSAALANARANLDGLLDEAARGPGVWASLASAAKSAASKILSVFKSALSLIKNAFTALLGTVKKVFSGIVSAIQRVGKAATNLAKTVGKKLLSAFKAAGSAAKKLFTSNKDLSSSVKGISKTLKKLIPAMLAARGVMGILRKAVNAFMDANEEVASQLSACWTSLGNILGPIITRIVNLVSTAIAYVTAFLRLFGLGGGGGGVKTISGAGKAVGGLSSATKIATVSATGYSKTAVAAYEAVGDAAMVASTRVDQLGETAAGVQTIAAGATAASDELNQMSDEAKKTGKEIQNLSGLDQLNTWKSQNDAGGGGGGGGGVDAGNVGLPEVELPDWVKQMVDAIQSENWGDAGHILASAFNDMVKSMLDDEGMWQTTAEAIGKKLAGVIEMAAQFVRDADFTGFFEGLFDGIRRAIEQIDGEDIGTLLASKFILIFSALQGALNSDIIPTATQTIVEAINSFFVTIREKFSEEDSNGWGNAGGTVGDFIMELVQSVATMLNEVDWDEIMSDIHAFWTGLYNALVKGEAGTVWGNLFAGLRQAIASIAWNIASWIPGTSQFAEFWSTLHGRLQRGEPVTWTDVFAALSALLGDLVGYITDLLPSDFVAFWNDLKNRIRGGNNVSTWDGIWDALEATVKGLVVKLLGWIPRRGDTAATWELLASHLETDGDSVTWGDIFSALKDTVEGLVEDLIAKIPENWDSFWESIKSAIVDATGTGSWENLTESVRSRVEGALKSAFDIALESLYSFISGKSEAMAALLFPNKAAVDNAKKQFETNLNAEEWVKGLFASGARSNKSQEEILKIVEQVTGTLYGSYDEVLAAARAGLLQPIEDSIQEGTPPAVEASENAANEIKSSFDPLFDPLDGKPTLVTDITDSIVENTPAAVEAAQALSDGVSVPMDEASKSIDKVTESTSNMSSTADDGTKTVGEAFIEMVSILTGENATANEDSAENWDAIKSVMTEAITAIRTMVTSNWDLMKSKVQTTNSNIKSNVTSTMNGIKSNVSSAMSTIRGTIQSNMTLLKNTVTTAMSNISQSASTAWANINTSAASGWSTIKGTVTGAASGIASSVSSSLGSLRNNAYSWGRDICSNMASGIRNNKSLATAAAMQLASSIRSIIHFSVPDKGPLSDADEYGGDLVQLISDKMTQARGLAVKAASGIAAAISDEIQSGDYSISRITASRLEGVGDTLADKLNLVMDRMQAIADSITFRPPTVATAGVVPYSVAGGGAPRQGGSQDSEKLDQLIALMGRIASGGGVGQKSENRYTFIGELDGKVLFQKVISEGQTMRRTTGRNPFMLGG